MVPNSTGVPSPMARHFAYTFVRDPLILFEEDLVEGAANGTQHCEVRTSAEESYLTLAIIAVFLLPTSYYIVGNFCEHKFFHQQTCQEKILISHQECKLWQHLLQFHAWKECPCQETQSVFQLRNNGKRLP